MPASRPKKTRTSDTRLRIAFSANERSSLRGAAAQEGLKEAALVRKAALAAIEKAAAEGVATVDAGQRRTLKTRTYFNEGEKRLIAAKAKEHGLSVSEFQRAVVLHAVGLSGAPKKKRSASTELLHQISANTFQLRGIGRNFNQLVKKANEGAVPLTRGEVEYFHNALQLALSKNAAAVEALLG